MNINASSIAKRKYKTLTAKGFSVLKYSKEILNKKAPQVCFSPIDIRGKQRDGAANLSKVSNERVLLPTELKKENGTIHQSTKTGVNIAIIKHTKPTSFEKFEALKLSKQGKSKIVFPNSLKNSQIQVNPRTSFNTALNSEHKKSYSIYGPMKNNYLDNSNACDKQIADENNIVELEEQMDSCIAKNGNMINVIL